MLMSQTIPVIVRVELFSYVNTFVRSNKTCMAAGQVTENALFLLHFRTHHSSD